MTKVDIRLPPGKGFMGDLTITTITHVQVRLALCTMDETTTWTIMKFKPSESSLVMKRRSHKASH